MFESTQQIKKTDLDYYVINNQWFRVAYTVIFRTEIRRSCPQRYFLATLSLIINKKRKRKQTKILNIFACIY